MGNPDGELSILLTGGSEIRRLNRMYRNVPEVTDVLSFPSAGGPGPATLGDIIISVPTARRQAGASGVSLERELLFLLVHGLLHLLKYDHEKSPAKAKEMDMMQRRLMDAGYGR
ncbi:MAG: hypothetical protein IEMM0002_0792 [bacterium]|nr:MAG: hypothetical protein IEMM0002_0792 [bacterium]